MNLRSDESKIDFGGVVSAWNRLRQETQIGVIRSAKDYDAMVDLMDKLVDQIGDNEDHKLAGLLDLVSTLVERYEEENVQLPEGSPNEVLRFLMEQQGLRQSDLADDLGSQGVVSEILSGRREINARQAKTLAARFGVSPAVFL